MCCRIAGGGSIPVDMSRPTVSPHATRRCTSSASRASSRRAPSAVMNVQCSTPSAPAARASRIASTAWACAVTGRPRAWASSTNARNTSGGNCVASQLVPGVICPPDAITLTTSTSRSACSRTALRTPSTPLVAAPRK